MSVNQPCADTLTATNDIPLIKANKTMGIITRYFLRRLAIARRERKYSTPSAYHWDAMVEVILIVFALPGIAVFSFLLISTMKWSLPRLYAIWPGFSPRLVCFVIWALTLIVGHQWLSQRFKKYLDDPSAYLNFDTDKDRRTAFWQKFVVLVVCGLVIPGLGLAVMYFLQ